jgi:beta-glucosidase/6-phospho-beta-glucosidase/beta-galactosidase
MIEGTKHDALALEDYNLLQSIGFRVARDALRWHLIDRGSGAFDFSSFASQLNAANATGTQVIWSLCHYGFPDGLDIFSAQFVKRFVQFSVAAARFIREHTDDIPYFNPINEVSFFSWAGSRNILYPFAEGRDNELKRQLVRASVEACHELRAMDSRTRFVFPEPIIHVVPPLLNPELAAEAKQYDESQFEAWDMIAGRLAPELGGSEDLLDIIGMNFYHSNQWECRGGRLEWEKDPRDPRWSPLHRMMERVWQRYRRPLFLAETSHVGVGRADWIIEVAKETALARQIGVPVEGICLFPIVDRFDWTDSSHWHNSGLWDIRISDGSFERVLNDFYARALKSIRHLLPQ